MVNGVFSNVHPHPSPLKVIVCTCAASAMLHEDPTKSSIRSPTHIFIDEAGQVLPLSLFDYFEDVLLATFYFDCTVFKVWNISVDS